MFLSNLSDSNVSVSVIYSAGAGGTQTEFKNIIQLAPRERKEFTDFFVSALGLTGGFGQLIFNGCVTGGNCSATNQDTNGFSPDFRDIAVFSRIYSIPPGTTLSQNPPTQGQDFSGIPWYHYVTSQQAANGLDKVFITGIKQTGSTGQAGTYRSNIGIVNASQYSTTTIVVKLFNGATGAQIGSNFTQQLSPLGHVQANLSNMFPGFTGSNVYVTVEQTGSVSTGSDVPASCGSEGCPGFLAYGSVLDNVSGDATTLEAVYLKALDSSAINAIYGGSGKPPLRRTVKH
ncbi:MAG TPA: hypothetical protein VMU84_01765 [Thermoanaerobaculia bacterium]|nr:hypothetical protein [Thermoanaerobaculia bacterium]